MTTSPTNVTGGRIRGRHTDGVHEFLGIPYAAAPVGDARFRAPGPVTSWDGVRDATQPGPSCHQSPYSPELEALLGRSIVPGDESLNLNVWTPDPGARGLPVMVWIHGGAFVRGGNAVPSYDGRHFARSGVVLVSINYRLGISGFAELDGAPSNRGILDQLRALEWVRENIAAFGGDPDNVTVFGESAGAISVATLLASPLANGLFAKAVVQSGSPTCTVAPADARRVASEFAEVLGVPATAAAFSAVEPRALQAAQDAVEATFQQNPDPARWGATTARNGLGIMYLMPVADGVVLESSPLTGVTGRRMADVPLLIGTTADEFRVFLARHGRALSEESLRTALAAAGLEPAEVIAAYRAGDQGRTPFDVLAAVLTDWGFRDGTYRLAQRWPEHGGRSYLYEFGWRTPVADLRACHALEIPFVFDTLDRGPGLTGTGAPADLATEMHRTWVRFAETGQPGWPPFDPDGPTVRVFDTEGGIELPPRLAELSALRRARRKENTL